MFSANIFTGDVRPPAEKWTSLQPPPIGYESSIYLGRLPCNHKQCRAPSRLAYPFSAAR